MLPFRCTLFNVIWVIEKPTYFRCTLLRTISMSEKSMLFWRTFLEKISMDETSMSFRMYFFRPNLDGQKNQRCFHKICNFDGKLMQIQGADFALVFIRRNFIVVLASFFEKPLVYQKLKPLCLWHFRIF